MKKYVSPRSYSIVNVNNSNFKQVANSFSRGFAKGVSAGMKGNFENPVSLKPIQRIIAKSC